MANLAVGDTIREKREAILRIAAMHGATEVRLIGSVARGEARPDSDVDLLVTWREGSSLLDQAALMLELESLLGGKSTSPATAGSSPQSGNRSTGMLSPYEERRGSPQRYHHGHRQEFSSVHSAPSARSPLQRVTPAPSGHPVPGFLSGNPPATHCFCVEPGGTDDRFLSSVGLSRHCEARQATQGDGLSHPYQY